MEALVHTASDALDGSVTRWRQFGHDRLYVRSLNGTDLGWWDLRTDEGHPLDARSASVLEGLVRVWQEEQRLGTTARPVLRQVPPLEEVKPRRAMGYAPTVRSVVEAPADLLTNRAGEQLLRREAAEVAAGRTQGRRFADFAPGDSGWEVGAAGEQLVADELAKLSAADPRWGFIHSIPVNRKGTDIDHLVIGPGGVFTLNTKHHRDATVWVAGDLLTVNGQKTWYIRNSRREAERASARLSEAVGAPIAVRGLVVPVGAATLTVKRSPEDVAVVNRRRLVSYFTSLDTVLDKDVVLAVFAAARDSRTWLDLDA